MQCPFGEKSLLNSLSEGLSSYGLIPYFSLLY